MTAIGTKKVRLVALLAAGHTYDECAAALQMSKRTIVRLNATPTFASELRAARSTLLDQMLGILATEAKATIRTLIELRDGGSESVRLGACRTLLDKLVATREQVELEARMAAIEMSFANNDRGAR